MLSADKLVMLVHTGILVLTVCGGGLPRSSLLRLLSGRHASTSSSSSSSAFQYVHLHQLLHIAGPCFFRRDVNARAIRMQLAHLRS